MIEDQLVVDLSEFNIGSIQDTLVDYFRQDLLQNLFRNRLPTTICPNFYLKDRIRVGYPSHIRCFIRNFVQRLLSSSSIPASIPPQILILILLLNSGEYPPLSKFVEKTETDEGEDIVRGKHPDKNDISDEDDKGNDVKLGNITNQTDSSNEVIEKIALENWDIPIGAQEGPTTGEYGVIYDRYSSEQQDETGCVNRVKTMLDEAEEREIPLYSIPIVDIAKSGKTVDREGMKRIIGLVQHPQIKYFFVHDIPRLARRNAFCLFLTDLLTRDSDVEMITAQGMLDMSLLEDLALAWVSSMAGEMTNRNKARNTLGGMIEQFEQGNPSNWYNQPPLGYSDADDVLFQIDEDEQEIVRACFKLFDASDTLKAYSETLDLVNAQYGPKLTRFTDNTNDDRGKLKRRQLKRLLQDPIYIGKPVAEGESIGDQGQKTERNMPELQIIEEELFDSVNEKIAVIEERYSNNSDPGEDLDLDYLTYEFGFLPLVESSPEVAVHCPECDSKMVRDGKRPSKDGKQKVPIYKCQECAEDQDEDNGSPDGTYKTYPNTLEHYKIKLFDELLDNIDELAETLDLEAV